MKRTISLKCFDFLSFRVAVHIMKPLNYRCHMGTRWIIPIASLHMIYIFVLLGFTAAVRHIEFRFHELKDLWHGILISASVVGKVSSMFPSNFFFKKNRFIFLVIYG